MQEYLPNKQDDIFDALAQTLPLIQSILPMDVMIGVADKEKFVYYIPSKDIDVKVSVGDPVPPQSGLMKVQQTGEKLSQILPKEVYGIPAKTITIPLKDNKGSIIGALSIGLNAQIQHSLHETAQIIASTTQEINSTTEELVNSAEQLAESLFSLKTSGESIITEIKKTDEILRFVNDIANNTNLLGLNASIEAARAGESGRGFNVVAREIQKMAIGSAKSVTDIKEILLSIQNNTSNMVKTLVETTTLGERQAAATEEISASIQQLSASAIDIEKASESI